MLGSKAVELLQEGLGFRSDQSERLLDRLNEAQDELETGPGDLPWFLLEEDASIVLAAGEDSITLPEGFIRIGTDQGPHFVDIYNQTRYLGSDEYSRLQRTYGDVDPGYPVAYALRKASIVFFPATLDGLTLSWSYYKHDDDISEGSENGWLANFPYVVIAQAGMKAARLLRDATAIKNFSDMKAEWKPRLFAEMERRSGADRDYHMGEDE